MHKQIISDRAQRAMLSSFPSKATQALAGSGQAPGSRGELASCLTFPIQDNFSACVLFSSAILI